MSRPRFFIVAAPTPAHLIADEISEVCSVEATVLQACVAEIAGIELCVAEIAVRERTAEEL